MKLHLLFIGNKFIYNRELKEYVIRKVEQSCDYIASVKFFKEGDNSIFLYLEKEFNSSNKTVIVTTKENFTTLGKLISTVTSDNQVLKGNMLVPSKVQTHTDGSYIINYKETVMNVVSMDEMQKMPTILLEDEKVNKATVNVFNEDKQSALVLLNPLAQTHDVHLEINSIVDGWLQVEIDSKRYGNISNFINSAKQLLSRKMIVAPSVIEHIIDVLGASGKKISFAESCTGGLLSSYFTKHNGASKILDGSLVTYSNDLKDNWLAVTHETLEECGAVSSEVVEQMSDGAMNVSSADYSLSISGIAGDTGGTELKPVGTVFIGVRSKTRHREEHLQLEGDRNYIQQQSVLYAIKLLLNIDKDIFF